ncbi:MULTISPECIES: hypothetical protein [unclassified Thioalkalivibrio]|uniref:hypothetical protein n=1 Tax=unclassified Thioalkalivibrio TaxID=2621013 RepID=UPI00036A2D9B|nr:MULTISPECIES: hypothetical protein [unclassified Thioalkalivibrio]
MDTPLFILGLLLIASLTTFFTGVLPYPIGWIILIIAFIARLLFSPKCSIA